MKVHGEGLADGSKSSNSDTDESELDLDDELDGDDLDDDVLSRKVSSDNRLTGIGRRSNGKQKRASLNSDGAEEDDDEEEEEEEDEDEEDDEEDEDLADAEEENTIKGLNGVKMELKREYSPEQNGDGKRAYTRRNIQRGLGAPKAGVRKPKKKLLMADNEASPIASVQQTPTPGKRGRKPRQVHLQDAQSAGEDMKSGEQAVAVGHRQAVQAADNSSGGSQINPLALSGAAGTPTYYPLGSYAAGRGHYGGGGGGGSNNNGSNQVSSNYASPSSQAQCNLTVAPPATDQYGRHHYSASQINQDSSSSPSTTTTAAATATSNSSAAATTERQTSLSSSMGQQGQQHHQQHQHGSQQLSSPAGGQTNGSSPQATLSEW